MARSEQEIFDAMLDAKDAEANLSTVNSDSLTAWWRLVLWIVAAAIRIHETLWDAFKIEVDAKVAAARPGSVAWYKQIALEFQYGYALTIVDNQPVYPVIDLDARIISRVAVVEGPELQFKVAKNLSGELEPLTAGEQSAFDAYINMRKFAGTKTSIVNLNRDLLRIWPDPANSNYCGTFYYDAQYDLAVVQADLDAKLKAFLIGLEYNGYLYAKKLDDIMQSVKGYVDHDFNAYQATTAAATDWQDIGRRYQPLSGYIATDDAFSEVLTFIPVTDVQS